MSTQEKIIDVYDIRFHFFICFIDFAIEFMYNLTAMLNLYKNEKKWRWLL